MTNMTYLEKLFILEQNFQRKNLELRPKINNSLCDEEKLEFSKMLYFEILAKEIFEVA